ncbi:MAG: hypothetical protein OEP52_05500 [Acidimicrobiia bacterium]|nr:hypothetical protein [Acidimicrobiia bacterium]
MQILSALFVESFEFRQVAGPATRIDLHGVYFSTTVSSMPATLEPHLIVLIRCAVGESGSDALEVVFRRNGEEVARNRQPVMIEPGKFGYQLVKGELAFSEPGTVEAHCRLVSESADPIVVPLTILPPIDARQQ